MRNYYIFISILGVVVLTGVVIGFVVGGNPTQLKEMGYDASRVGGFSTISYNIDNYFQTNNKLPTTLADTTLLPTNTIDPITKKPFVYEVTSPTSYKLCTDFSTDTTKPENMKNTYNYIGGTDTQKHKKGYDCITYKVNAPMIKNNVEPIKESGVSVQYSKLDPTSDIIGKPMGEIVTDTDLSIRVGPEAHLYNVAANSGYYLITFPVDPQCSKSATQTCEFLLSDLTLKTKDSVTIVKNINGDPLYTPAVYNNYGEIASRYNIPPNTASGGYLGFNVPTYVLLDKIPTDFLMTYKNSKPLTITITRN